VTPITKLTTLLASALFQGLATASYSFITTWAASGFGIEAVVISNILGILPGIVLSLLGGVLADRFDPRWLLFIGRAWLALSLCFLALVPLDSPAPIYLVVFLTSIIGTICSPAESTLVPSLFEKEAYLRVNARLNLVTDATYLAAPLAAGYLHALQGLRPVALTAALLIFLSALVLFLLPRLTRSTTARLNLAFALEGFSYAWGNRTLLGVLLFLGITNAYRAAFYTALPLFARSIGDAATYGLILSAMNTGMLLSNLLLSTFLKIPRVAHTAVILNFWEGLTLVLLGLARTPAQAWAPALVSEGLSNLSSIVYTSWIQATVSKELLGRVNAVVQIGGFVFTPLGFLLTTPLVATVNPVGTTMVLGAATAATAIAWYLKLPKEPPGEA